MKVFISWSGRRSHAAALTLRQWLQDVLQYSDPFVSSEDIAKGRRWLPEILSELKQARFGVICATPENIDARWLLFEAGALGARYTEGRVSCLLVGLSATDVEPPLSQFQNTTNDKAEISKLVAAINSTADDAQRLDDERLGRAVETHWPRLKERLREIEQDKQYEERSKPKRDLQSIAEETLETLRSMHRVFSDYEQMRNRLAVAEALAAARAPAADLGELISGLRPSGIGGLGGFGGLPLPPGGAFGVGDAGQTLNVPRGLLDPRGLKKDEKKS